jgi:hypothetical protein
VKERANKAMQNDGIYAIAVAELVENLTREACAEWDSKTLGPPPTEWKRRGY